MSVNASMSADMALAYARSFEIGGELERLLGHILVGMYELDNGCASVRVTKDRKGNITGARAEYGDGHVVHVLVTGL